MDVSLSCDEDKVIHCHKVQFTPFISGILNSKKNYRNLCCSMITFWLKSKINWMLQNCFYERLGQFFPLSKQQLTRKIDNLLHHLTTLLWSKLLRLLEPFKNAHAFYELKPHLLYVTVSKVQILSCKINIKCFLCTIHYIRKLKNSVLKLGCVLGLYAQHTW